MESFRNVLGRIEKAVDTCVICISGSLLLSVTILIFVQVICRYLLQSSLSWSEELTRYLMVWIVFLSAGYVLNKGGHANVDLLLNMVPVRSRIWLGRFIIVLLAVFAGILIRYGAMLMRFGSRQKSSALQIPMHYVYAAIPIGGALLVFYCLTMLVRKPVAEKAGHAAE